jgi:hypothetical protein
LRVQRLTGVAFMPVRLCFRLWRAAGGATHRLPQFHDRDVAGQSVDMHNAMRPAARTQAVNGADSRLAHLVQRHECNPYPAFRPGHRQRGHLQQFRNFYRNATEIFCAAQQRGSQVGFNDAFIYKDLCIDPSARNIPTEQLKTADSDKPFAEWMEKPDKIDY